MVGEVFPGAEATEEMSHPMPTPPTPDPLALDAAIDAIEERVGAELAGYLRGLVPPPRWVACEDRHPQSGVYLVMLGDYYQIGLWDGLYEWTEYGGPEIHPSHWMELPNPPALVPPVPGSPMLPFAF